MAVTRWNGSGMKGTELIIRHSSPWEQVQPNLGALRVQTTMWSRWFSALNIEIVVNSIYSAFPQDIVLVLPKYKRPIQSSQEGKLSQGKNGQLMARRVHSLSV